MPTNVNVDNYREGYFDNKIWNLEKDLQAFVMKELRKTPYVKAYKYPGGLHGEKGTPDLLICAKGAFVAIELKRGPKEQPTLLQQKNLREIEQAGGGAYVAYTWGMVKDILRKYSIEF